jgi:hypothetical protein
MEHGAWSMEHGAWGMGHGAWSMSVGGVFTTEARRTRRNTEKGVKQGVGFECGCGCDF